MQDESHVVATGGDVTFDGADPRHMGAVTEALRELGAGVEKLEGGMRVFGMSMFGDLAQQLDAVESGPDGRFTVHGLLPGIAHVAVSKKGSRLGTVEDVERAVIFNCSERPWQTRLDKVGFRLATER